MWSRGSFRSIGVSGGSKTEHVAPGKLGETIRKQSESLGRDTDICFALEEIGHWTNPSRVSVETSYIKRGREELG